MKWKSILMDEFAKKAFFVGLTILVTLGVNCLYKINLYEKKSYIIEAIKKIKVKTKKDTMSVFYCRKSYITVSKSWSVLSFNLSTAFNSGVSIK